MNIPKDAAIRDQLWQGDRWFTIVRPSTEDKPGRTGNRINGPFDIHGGLHATIHVPEGVSVEENG